MLNTFYRIKKKEGIYLSDIKGYFFNLLFAKNHDGFFYLENTNKDWEKLILFLKQKGLAPDNKLNEKKQEYYTECLETFLEDQELSSENSDISISSIFEFSGESNKKHLSNKEVNVKKENHFSKLFLFSQMLKDNYITHSIGQFDDIESFIPANSILMYMNRNPVALKEYNIDEDKKYDLDNISNIEEIENIMNNICCTEKKYTSNELFDYFNLSKALMCKN